MIGQWWKMPLIIITCPPIKHNIIHLYYIICMCIYIYIYTYYLSCAIYIYIPIWFWSCSSTHSLVPVSSTQSCSVSRETSAIRCSFGNRGLDYPKVREVSHPKLVFVMLFHHEIEDSSRSNTNVVIVVESKKWLVSGSQSTSDFMQTSHILPVP